MMFIDGELPPASSGIPYTCAGFPYRPVVSCDSLLSGIWQEPWLTTVLSVFSFLDADRARKHGLDEFVIANPCNFEHHELFSILQTLTLDYRLGDAYTCLVSSLARCCE